MADSSPKEAATNLVAAINAWQNAGNVHPLTCGVDSSHPDLEPFLNEADGKVWMNCTRCGYLQCVTGTSLEPIVTSFASRVLPGNPGSDWTEQDARDVEHAMRFVEEFFGDKRCSLNAKYSTALRREILRLRAELATLDADYRNLVAEVERMPGEASDSSAEQKARDMLDRMGVPDAQHYSSGDVVELANLIANADAASTSVRSPEVEEAGEDNG